MSFIIWLCWICVSVSLSIYPSIISLKNVLLKSVLDSTLNDLGWPHSKYCKSIIQFSFRYCITSLLVFRNVLICFVEWIRYFVLVCWLFRIISFVTHDRQTFQVQCWLQKVHPCQKSLADPRTAESFWMTFHDLLQPQNIKLVSILTKHHKFYTLRWRFNVSNYYTVSHNSLKWLTDAFAMNLTLYGPVWPRNGQRMPKNDPLRPRNALMMV